MNEKDEDRLRWQTCVEFTGNVVSAYVSSNPVSSAEISDLVYSVYTAVSQLSPCTAPDLGASRQPAIPRDESISEHKITCLECGRSFKTLKRHIGSCHNLSPIEYRKKWRLPPDYPLVAPAYTKTRSELAVKFKLGKNIEKDG